MIMNPGSLAMEECSLIKHCIDNNDNFQCIYRHYYLPPVIIGIVVIAI